MLLAKINRYLKEIRFIPLLRGNKIRVTSGGELKVSKGADVSSSTIIVGTCGQLSIEDGVKVKNAVIHINSGKCVIKKGCRIRSSEKNIYIGLRQGKIVLDEHAIIGCDTTRTSIEIDNGEVLLADHSKIEGARLWVRFGGKLEIGRYTNINKNSEIRSDESVIIGSYCQISYNVRIWDTNTHEILPWEERRRRTEDYYPTYGKELMKPKTRPVHIGDDCWIGEYSAILKGSNVGKRAIVGFHTLVLGEDIPEDSTVVTKNVLQKC